MYIFAGANGSGKTTMAEYYMTLPDVTIKEFVNADEIARGLSPFNPEGQSIQAGKLALQRRRELIKNGTNFAIETTLSGRGAHLINDINTAKAKGYTIVMIYCYSENVEVNLQRIKYRVIQGGHDVAVENVKRRYGKSLHNLLNMYDELCDYISVYDTTPIEISNALPIYDKIGNDIFIYDENLYNRLKSQSDAT